MKAVLLAAGLGTRLRPLTERVPKCLVPIAGRPLLDLWLDRLVEAGVEAIHINTHHLADQVQAHVAAHPARGRIRLLHEDRLLGTGGTLERMAPNLRGGTFLCIHADNLARFDLRALLRAHEHRPAGVDITLLSFDTDMPSSCGIIETDTRGVVTAFHEKVADPPGRRANGAIYVMEPAVLRFIAGLPGPVKDLSTEVLPAFLGRMQAWFDPATFLIDIGTPEALRRAEALWRGMEAHA